MQEEIGQKFYSFYFEQCSPPKIESLSTFTQTLFIWKLLFSGFYEFSNVHGYFKKYRYYCPYDCVLNNRKLNAIMVENK